MFYDLNSADSPKGLFKACIVPRPIAWISTISTDGITNLAPFSYFQAVCDSPPMIMFVASPKQADGKIKDTVRNIESTKEFVINLVPESAKEEMMQSSESLDFNDSEIDKFHIPIKKSRLVAPPTIAISPINLECKYVRTIDIEKNKMIIGQIIGISLEDGLMDDGKIKISNLKLLSRLGYDEYNVVEQVLHIKKPSI